MEIVIIGGVAGGATCAARLRRLSEDVKVTVFEKGPYVSFANCGLPYFVGHVIEKQSSLLLASPELFHDRFEIEAHVLEEVLSIDSKAKKITVKTQDSKVFEKSYDKLLLSTGSTPIVPNLPGINRPGVFTVKTIPDSVAIRNYITEHNVREAVIIGGGFIGLEMAENFVHLKLKTTIIALELMPPFDPEMLESVEQHIVENGVDMRLGQQVTGFESEEANPDNIYVTTNTGGRFRAQLVILAIGVRPETTLARSAGLELGPKTGAIATNDRMQTSDPDIYAVGDCVETLDYVAKVPTVVPLAGPANRQARVAADAMLGREGVRYRGMQGTAVCKVFDLTMASTGLSEKSAKRHGIAYEKVYLHPNQHVGYYPGAKSMKFKLVFNPADGKVLGCQVVGREGVDKRVDVIATAIQGGLTVFDLEEAELCYAPQFGAAKDPVNLVGMVASNAVRGDAPVVHWLPSLDPDAFLLDVRNPGEFAAKRAPDAINIPLPELRHRMGSEVPRDKKVLVYCGVGQRAYYATRILRLNGYDAYNVSGGIGMFPQNYKRGNL